MFTIYILSFYLNYHPFVIQNTPLSRFLNYFILTAIKTSRWQYETRLFSNIYLLTKLNVTHFKVLHLLLSIAQRFSTRCKRNVSICCNKRS